VRPQALTAIAVSNGCTALAITDHGDLRATAATPDYFAQIETARKQFPDLILFAGLEWNIPPYRGREHVNVLLEPRRSRPLIKRRPQRSVERLNRRRGAAFASSVH
jgi:hypothetical protein